MLIYHAWMICSLSGLSHALSWSLLKQKQTYVSSQYKPAAVQEERDSFLPSHDGSDALALAESHAKLRYSVALESSSRRSDCSGRAIAFINTRCGEVEMDEDERVRAAIALTVCELRTTRHQSLPMECSLFNPDSTGFSVRNVDIDAQSLCVEALSRSAQFWSSYSGHLRDVAHSCFAYRSMSDRDTAKQIYRNVTDDMIAYLRSLREHEHQKATAEIQRATAIRDSEARIAAQEARAAESDRARAAAWEAQDLALMDTIVTWDSRIAKREDERHAREVKFSNNMERYVESLRESYSAVLLETVGKISSGVEEILAGFTETLSEHKIQAEEDRMHGLRTVDVALTTAADQHVAALQAMVPGIQQVLAHQLYETFGEYEVQHRVALGSVITLSQYLRETGFEVANMRKNIAVVNADSHSIRNNLQQSNELSQSIHEAQHALQRDTEGFNEKVSQNYDQLEDRARTLNDTLAQIRPPTMVSGLIEGYTIGFFRWILPQVVNRADLHWMVPAGVQLTSSFVWLLVSSSFTFALYLLAKSRRWIIRLRQLISLDDLRQHHTEDSKNRECTCNSRPVTRQVDLHEKATFNLSGSSQSTRCGDPPPAYGSHPSASMPTRQSVSRPRLSRIPDRLVHPAEGSGRRYTSSFF